MKIGIIGAGNIGGTLGRAWAAQGHDVVYGVREGGRAPESGQSATIPEAASAGEVVVLATPWNAVEEVLTQINRAGDEPLRGKVLIDCTNFGFDETRSGAERIAAWAPGARVVKAFNQAGFETLAEPEYDGHRAVMLVAGDDADARQAVIGLGEAIGLEMVDAGALANARLLEQLAALWVHLAFRQGLGRGFAFGVLRRS